MNKSKIKRYAVVLLVLAVLLIPVLPAAEVATEESLELATFDKAWEIIRDTHFDPTFNGVDWDQVREDLRPKAAEATAPGELRQVLLDMVGRLGQSHFSIIPKSAVDADLEAAGGEGDLGMEVRMLEDRLVVTSVEEGEPAWNGGIRPGWIVDGVGDKKFADALKSIRENQDWRGEDLRLVGFGTALLTGEPGSSVELAMLDGDDKALKVELTRRKMPGESVKFGNLPPFMIRFDSREIRDEETGPRVGVIDFNAWMLPVAAQFDEAIDQFREMDGIIIDLRGNPGGIGGMVMGIAGHFYTEKAALGTFSMRTQEMFFKANPRRVTRSGEKVQPYAGPVAILMDRMSASTSEMFAGGMQESGRVRVFGRSSAGMVLPAYMDRLPNDDVLYHAIADYRTPSGVLLEGRGVIPDETIPLSRPDLLAGRDRTLEAALNWIGSAQTATNEN